MRLTLVDGAGGTMKYEADSGKLRWWNTEI